MPLSPGLLFSFGNLSRKAFKMPKKPTEADLAIERENEGAEQIGGHLSTVDQIIEHFIDEGTRRECTPVQWIYKYDNEKSGDDRQGVGKFSGDEMKDQHAIGLLFGAGRYGIQLYVAKGKSNGQQRKYITFRLGPVYDKYKAEADAERQKKELERMTGQPGALPAIPDAGNTAAAQSFLMVKEILSLVLPIVAAGNKAAAPAPIPRQESPAEMFNSYTMMQKLLKNNLFDTAETMKQFARRYNPAAIEAEEIDTEPQEPEPEKSTMQKIIDLIEPFFSLIANKSPAASLAAQGLRSAPQFVEILNDPALCRMIVQYFDKTKGRAASDMALQNIGINRAALFQQQAQQLTAPRAATGQSRPTPAPAAPRPINGKKTALKQKAETATA